MYSDILCEIPIQARSQDFLLEGYLDVFFVFLFFTKPHSLASVKGHVYPICKLAEVSIGKKTF